MIELALELDERTAAQRQEDDGICQDPFAQAKGALARAEKQQVGPAAAPKILSPDVYKPKQDRARAEMGITLRKLLEL